MKINHAVCSILLLAAAASAQELSSYAAPDEAVSALSAALAGRMQGRIMRREPCPSDGRITIDRGGVACDVYYPARIRKIVRHWSIAPKPEDGFELLKAGDDVYLVYVPRKGSSATVDELMKSGALVTSRDAARANDMLRAAKSAEGFARMIDVPSLDRIFPR